MITELSLIPVIACLIARGLRPFTVHNDKFIECSKKYCQIERRSRSPGNEFNGIERRQPRSDPLPLYVSPKQYWIILSIFSIGCFLTSAFSLRDPFKTKKNSPPNLNLISKLFKNNN